MGRFKIIVADSDEDYIQSFIDYLSTYYSHWFEVNSFTKIQYLSDFLSKNQKEYDMLLISHDLHSQYVHASKITFTAILTSGKYMAEDKSLKFINKYQHVEKLVSDIMNILSEGQNNKIYMASGSRMTKVIGVYSAAGGTGLTTVALGCSIQCAMRGFRVFYLNFESLCSTLSFFECDNKKSISKILYYLKEGNKNISLKIEAGRCIHNKYNIHYFSPTDSSMDMEELSPEELEQLVTNLKLMGQYDYIFIDISNGFNSKNLKVLEISDYILMVCTQDSIYSTKHKFMFEQISRLNPIHKSQLMDKSEFVINKYREGITFNIQDLGKEGQYVYKIPYIEQHNMDILECIRNETFASSINQIIEGVL